MDETKSSATGPNHLATAGRPWAKQLEEVFVQQFDLHISGGVVGVEKRGQFVGDDGVGVMVLRSGRMVNAREPAPISVMWVGGFVRLNSMRAFSNQTNVEMRPGSIRAAGF